MSSSRCQTCPRDDRAPPKYQVDTSSKCNCSGSVNQSTIPVYAPKCCPVPANTDPRRNTAYCPPVVSRSEPLSHAEYLRRLKSGARGGVSTPAALVQVGEGEYKKTLWMESGTVCCSAPVTITVPAVHPIGHRLDNTGRAEVAGAVAGRGTISHFDQGDRDASLTTMKEKGLALAADKCTPCATITGSTVVPTNGECC